MKEINDNTKLQDLFKISLDRVKTLMETNTIIGETIKVDQNTSVIPISKASVGFVVGGGEYSDKSSKKARNNFPMAGGSGCGMSVSPVGFIVIQNKEVKFIDIENKTMYQTILNLINKVIASIKTDETEKKED